jgi:hypothetical protein
VNGRLTECSLLAGQTELCLCSLPPREIKVISGLALCCRRNCAPIRLLEAVIASCDLPDDVPESEELRTSPHSDESPLTALRLFVFWSRRHEAEVLEASIRPLDLRSFGLAWRNSC